MHRGPRVKHSFSSHRKLVAMSYKSLFVRSRFEDLYHNMKVRLFIEFILAESLGLDDTPRLPTGRG
jgi:hypothetical protein